MRKKKVYTDLERWKIILYHVRNKGIWVVTDLGSYEMIHYPRAFCRIEEDPRAFGERIVRVIDGNGVCLGVFEYEWFNINWNYDRRYLLHECEKTRLQIGIHNLHEK